MPTKMRPFGKTIALEEARAIIERAIIPIDRTEVLPLHEANGRVLAQDVGRELNWQTPSSPNYKPLVVPSDGAEYRLPPVPES